MINNGDNTFEIKSLPNKAQYAPVYASKAHDFDGDGNIDILLAGNLHAAKPQVGKYDANYGILLLGDGKGNFSEIDKAKGGFWTPASLMGNRLRARLIENAGLTFEVV